MTLQAALTKITRERVRIITKDPFFGILALGMPLVEASSQIETMATDGTSIFFNIGYVLKLKPEELRGVILEELLHCTMSHHTRKGARDHKRWNIACDHALGPILIDVGKLNGFTVPDDGYTDETYRGFSAETIYNMLPPGKRGEGSGPGRGIIIQPQTRDERQAQEEAWTNKARAAAAQARAVGKLPAGLEFLIDELDEPKVDWRQVLRRFVDAGKEIDYSWARFNKRHVHAGIYLPAMDGGVPNKLICILDSSGSVSDKELKGFMSEVQSYLDEQVCETVILAFADTGLYGGEEYHPGDLLHVKGMGRGGTDFRVAMAWLASAHPDATACIFFTDMAVYNWGDKPPMPVMWATFGGMYAAGYKPPFGEVLYIESEA